MTIGNVYQSWEDWANALTAFDQALALLPSHPDARLGRVISLSNLDRHDEAIASATELIDAGRWHLGQAFYWRAWNYFNIGNNQAARADADRTRTLMVNPAVFLLSGLIEWRFLRRETAETEFQEALKMDFGQCEAAFYLGGVRAELRKVPEAMAAMNQARQCYDLAISVRRRLFEDAHGEGGDTGSQSPRVREARTRHRNRREAACRSRGRDRTAAEIADCARLRRLLPDRHLKAGDRFSKPDTDSRVGDVSSVLRHAKHAKARNLDIKGAQRVVDPKAPVAADRTLWSRIERRDGEQALLQRDLRRAIRRRHAGVVHDAALDNTR